MASTESNSPSLHSLLSDWLSSAEKDYHLYIDGMTSVFRKDGDMVHISIDLEEDIPGIAYDQSMMLKMVWPSMASFFAALAWRRETECYCLIDTIPRETGISLMVRRLESILNQADTWHSMLSAVPTRTNKPVQSRTVSQVQSLGSALLMESLHRQSLG
ncbi:hypothetical protein ACKC9G_15930 [Pokkaliibacter sp. CJK22405]|uniref:hypothetical protein n=1 Tax=Pokkaliibacter sp. CJK22405 TaxID=3384615 RepID=UPI0039852FD1